VPRTRRAEATNPAPNDPLETTGEPDAPHWTDQELALRAEGKSWSQIAAATGKSISTIRDAVRRALEPVGAS
jgi:hypothetical protein